MASGSRAFRWLALPLIAAAGVAATGMAQTQLPMEPNPDDPASIITAESFRSRLSILTADSMQGRNTPSDGLETAAAWLVSEHRAMGLTGGAGAGEFHQRWPYRLIRPGAAALSVRSGGTSVALDPADGVAVFGGGSGSVDASLVVLTGLSPLPAPDGVEGRAVVLALSGDGGRATVAQANRLAQWVQGAGGVALIGVLDAGVGNEVLATSAIEAAQGSWRVGDALPLPQVLMTRSAAETALGGSVLALLGGGGPDAGLRVVDGVRLEGSVSSEVLVDGRPSNVVALLEGSDPELKNEYIVLSAHYDHVGIGRPVDGDSIYNGADDNGSGTVGLLEVARALSSLPTRPRRSILFVHVSGEEKGLLGSSWFVDHSPIPVDQMVANLNADMIGGDAHRDTLVVIGKDYSDMGALVDGLNARMPELRLTTSDDLWPEQRFFFRSDQFHFMRKEIPSLFFFTGVHECYHRPCDDVDFVDHDKAARIARLLTHVALELANRDERPVWAEAGLAEVRALVGQGR